MQKWFLFLGAAICCLTTSIELQAGENDLTIGDSPDSWAMRQSFNNAYYDWCFVSFEVVVPAEHTRFANVYVWNPATSQWSLCSVFNYINDGPHTLGWYNDPNNAISSSTELNFSALYDTYDVKIEFFDVDTGHVDTDIITIDDLPQ